MSTLQIARSYIAAGLSVIPIRADGSKAPAITSWKPYQDRIPTDAELVEWFSDGRNGIAIVSGGPGNREVIDFDSLEKFSQYKALADSYGLTELLKRCALVKTPRPGYQISYRCAEPVQGNLKLAYEMLPIPAEPYAAKFITRRGRRFVQIDGEEYPVVQDDEGRDRALHCGIETRGEGGYVVAPGSPAACHPKRTEYKTVRGDLCDLPVLTADEREALLDLARALDEKPAESVVGMTAKTKSNRGTERPVENSTDTGLRPGDDYNRRGDFRALLETEGWQKVTSAVTTVEKWRRPGKTRGWSATVREWQGVELFHCFTSNGAPFEADKTYSPFGVYAALEHNGNFSAAASALCYEEYGDRLHAMAVIPDIEDEPLLSLESVIPVDKTGRHNLIDGYVSEGVTVAGHTEQVDETCRTNLITDYVAGGPEGSDELDTCPPPRIDGLLPAIRDLAVVHPQGLTFPRELNVPQLEALGRRLVDFYNPTIGWCRWAIGDWYNSIPEDRGPEGKPVRGPKRDRVIALFRKTMWQQVQNFAQVARAWPMEKRRSNITCWSFYMITARKCFTAEEREAYAEQYVSAGGKRTKDGKKSLRDVLMAEIGDEIRRRKENARKRDDFGLIAPPDNAAAVRAYDRVALDQEIAERDAAEIRAFLQWMEEKGKAHVLEVMKRDRETAAEQRTSLRSDNDSDYVVQVSATPHPGGPFDPEERAETFLRNLLTNRGPLPWREVLRLNDGSASPIEETDLGVASASLSRQGVIDVDPPPPGGKAVDRVCRAVRTPAGVGT